MKLKLTLYIALLLLPLHSMSAQINTERVMNIGRNALYFEDYVLSIQYFNQVIQVKPYLAEPYFFRGVAKLSLDDMKGAEEDCTEAISRNPFIVDAYQVRGIARQNLKDYTGAVADYEAGLKYAPESRVLLINRAIAQTELEEYDKAAQSFDELIAKHPSYYNAYLTRGQFELEQGDTLQAIKDIDRAIELDKYLSYAYAQRAIIKMQYQKEYAEALVDMEQAIELDPKMVAYYLNRGLIKYRMNNLRGTMADYDRVLELDPSNLMAHYNRGLLRIQVGDTNRAIEDFTAVIERDPSNHFARYNRALLYHEVGSHERAVADFDRVLEEYPNFTAGYYARSEAKRKMNHLADAEADYLIAMNMSQADKKSAKSGTDPQEQEESAEADTRKESDKNIERFSSLLVADDNKVESKYNSDLRGRVQDKNVDVAIQTPFVLTYYELSNKLTPSGYYNKELDNFNRAHLLTRKLLVTNAEAALTEAQIAEHFSSIDTYSHTLEVNANNPITYFARSLDFMLVQDFASALDDLNRVIMMSNNFIYAYFNRAVVRFKQLEYNHSTGVTSPEHTALNSQAMALEYEMVVRDYEKVLQIDPTFVYAYYNRGNVRFAQRDYRAALDDYNHAIELRPNFAEAYYNRGLIHLSQGNTQQGTADLSKAGELGVVEAYNILKRMSDKTK